MTNASKITEVRTSGPEKIASTKKVRNRPQMDFPIFPGGDTPKSLAQTKFEAKPA